MLYFSTNCSNLLTEPKKKVRDSICFVGAYTKGEVNAIAVCNICLSWYSVYVLRYFPIYLEGQRVRGDVKADSLSL